MLFNPDITKPAKEVIFLGKYKNRYPAVYFNEAAVAQTFRRKHVGEYISMKR